MGKYYKRLIGERVYLSPISMDDVPQYTEWMSNAAVSDNLGASNVLYSEESEKEFLEALIKGGHNFAIIRKEDDKLLGNCGFFDIHETNRTAEIGLFLGDPKTWGKGYGTEAIALMLDHGFNTMNYHNIQLKVYDFNERAQKCYRSLGFTEIGRRREAYYVRGRYYDQILMDMLKSDWVKT